MSLNKQTKPYFSRFKDKKKTNYISMDAGNIGRAFP